MGIINNIFGKKEAAKENSSNGIEWLSLNSNDELTSAIEASMETPVLLFKHSTRCSISSSALSRVTRSWNNSEVNVKPYLLDLIAHREVSAEIADRLNVVHQSPQMIIVHKGKAIFNSSHMEINFSDVVKHAPIN